jgi:hypothetical protein
MTLKRLFKLLDEYSRNVHNCFLAEMNVNEQLIVYSLCFRPLRSNSSDPYACRYVEIDAEEIHTLNRTRSLPVTITDLLDAELTPLRPNLR